MVLSKFALRYDLRGMTVDAADIVDGILIDPANAPDSNTPNEDRPIEEILAWWRRPYITTGGQFTIRCLDGGAWDRPTVIGWKETLAEAVEVAQAYRPKASEVRVYVG